MAQIATGTPVHRASKTTQEKEADPDGKGAPSGSQKGGKKQGKTRQGRTVGAEEHLEGKRHAKEQARLLKPRLWCETCNENQEMRVFEILQKSDTKGGVK